MSDLENKIEEVFYRLVDGCPDPKAREFRQQFEDARTEARGRFGRWRRESLDARRHYHDVCGHDKEEADRLATQDVRLLEIDALICCHWQRFTERLSRLLEDVKDG